MTGGDVLTLDSGNGGGVVLSSPNRTLGVSGSFLAGVLAGVIAGVVDVG